ncbi:uncharacterized protein LOC124855868 [Girardinichthys multiradiatus]|uniref:uncharacterized protein LOC124855868 n=1 Tax=Girardinichthys multiradiatus TaxID=208333 RepID=UPI001FAE4AC9|nr:uncharacterized protein LOC124855868 [Girardinichthys multiradiatus]XP_047201950.1 uncharacterized protein LOC124855868 [Girardinichthys multiradiatus]
MHKNNYFLNMMKPPTHIFLTRNILRIMNEELNNRTIQKIQKTIGSSSPLTYDVRGRVILDAAHVPPSLNQVGLTDWPEPNRSCWEKPLTIVQREMLTAAMSKPGDDIIAEAGSILLSRRTFGTLPQPSEVEGDVINACMLVLQKMALSKYIEIFPADCHTVSRRLPPMSACPFQHLPADASSKDTLVFPSWRPGHWMICVIKPKLRESYFLNSLQVQGPHDEAYRAIYSNICQKLCPGLWTQFTTDDIEDVPRQGLSHNCGIFTLMYALYITLGGQFDFSEADMPTIRLWRYVLLLENFPARSTIESVPRKD